jgi:hypothetical protein
MGDRRGVYRVFVGKPQGINQLGRPKCRWDYIIKMDLKQWDGEAWAGVNWLRTRTGGRHL